MLPQWKGWKVTAARWCAWGWVLLVATQALGAGYARPELLVDGNWLAARLSDPGLRIVDARQVEAYRASHLPGAVSLPMNELRATVGGIKGMLAPVEQVVARLSQAGIDERVRVIVYDDKGDDWATRAFWTLEYLGHPRVAILDGGFAKWRGEGRPTTTVTLEVQASRFVAKVQPQRLVSGDWILQNLHKRGIRLLDSRSAAEYQGRDVRSARGGHIPGAEHIDWVRSLQGKEFRVLRSADELLALYGKPDGARSSTVVTYCQTGARASHTYFVLRLLGYQDVRLYDGSWEEWGNNPRFPVEAGQGEKGRVRPVNPCAAR